jgi:hypothetical protein
MEKLIRKISIGKDYKNEAMHYSVGQEVYGGHTINAIVEDKKESNIHGEGIFSKKNITKGDIIGLGSVDTKHKTVLGRYVNHSNNNNAKFYYLPNKDLIMLAEKNILKDTEILVNYRHHTLENERIV